MLVKFNFLSQALMEQTNVTMILPSWTLFDSGKGKAESYVPGTKFQVLYLLHANYVVDARQRRETLEGRVRDHRSA